jgi:hypothetical protein
MGTPSDEIVEEIEEADNVANDFHEGVRSYRGDLLQSNPIFLEKVPGQ